MKTCGIILCSAFLLLSIAQTTLTFKLQNVHNANEGPVALATANNHSASVLVENSEARKKRGTAFPEWAMFIPGLAPAVLIDTVGSKIEETNNRINGLEAENAAKQHKIQEEQERLRRVEISNRIQREREEARIRVLEAENAAKQRAIQEEQARLQENESKSRMFREQQEARMRTLEAENAAKQRKIEEEQGRLRQIELDIERRRRLIDQENAKIEQENKRLEDLLKS